MTESRSDRLCLFAAFGLTLLWGSAYIAFARSELCDESGHVSAAQHLAERLPGWPSLPHPPAYHLFVNALSFNHPVIATARATSVLFALLALVAFAGAWRRLHRTDPGPPTLVFALLPILQPFTAMAYTDVTSLAWLLCAWWAQVSGHFFRAAALMAVACLVRQTNAIWAAFIIAWELLRAFESPPDSRPAWRGAIAAAWTRGRWHLLLLAAGAIAILALGRFTPGRDHGNALETNVAAFHFAAWLALLLGLPLWLQHARHLLPAARPDRGLFSGRRLARTAGLLVVVAALAATFRNPHEWNQMVWWGTRSGQPYALVRNWPLLQVDAHLWLRVLSGVSIVAAAHMAAALFRPLRHRRALWLTLPFGAILLGTNSLVDPRYCITPAVMLLCFVDFERRTWLRLAAWFGLLCALHAPFILAGKSLW